MKTGILKAKPLQPGDTVGLISPASSVSAQQFLTAVQNLESLGLNVVTGKHSRLEHGHLGGLDHQRLEDLHHMFANPNIDGIWCTRGGYGCTRLLPSIDFDLIRQNPKPLIGYSDITVLLNAIFQETGLIGFHGPLGISVPSEYTVSNLKTTVFGAASTHQISLPDNTEPPYIIHPGTAEGRFVGGNLALLAAMTGTPHQPDYQNKLVFIEEIAEKPYQIDRMLTQLLQGTNFREAAGFLLGTFVKCGIPAKGSSLSLEVTLKDRLVSLGIPAIYGAPIGHIDDQITVPVGGKGRLQATEEGISIQLLETGTEQLKSDL